MVDPASEDALTPALEGVRLGGSVFGAGELCAPWGVRTPGLPHFAAYLLAEGQVQVTVDGFPPISVCAGEAVLVAPQRAHTLQDGPDAAVVPFARLLAEAVDGRLARGGSGRRTTLICCTLTLDPAGRALFEAALPGRIVVDAAAGGPGWAGIVAALLAEASHPAQGSPLVRTRLAELVFLEAVRSAIRGRQGVRGWLGALERPQLARALAAIHRRPAEPWTVASLAGIAHMSRTTFALDFTDAVGQTPLRYVTSWRMHVAMGLLDGGTHGLKSVARRVGYSSDEAFSRAFHREVGVSPGRWERLAPEADGR